MHSGSAQASSSPAGTDSPLCFGVNIDFQRTSPRSRTEIIRVQRRNNPAEAGIHRSAATPRAAVVGGGEESLVVLAVPARSNNPAMPGVPGLARGLKGDRGESPKCFDRLDRTGCLGWHCVLRRRRRWLRFNPGPGCDGHSLGVPHGGAGKPTGYLNGHGAWRSASQHYDKGNHRRHGLRRTHAKHEGTSHSPSPSGNPTGNGPVIIGLILAPDYTSATVPAGTRRANKKPRSNQCTGVLCEPSWDGLGHRHMWSIMTWPKPEHDTCVAPSIRRAKS